MNPVFFEIWFEGDSLERVGIESLDTLEDPLDEALETSNLGYFSGGGSGERGSNIDVEIYELQDADEALELIRRVLRENGAPPETTIRKVVSIETFYTL